MTTQTVAILGGTGPQGRGLAVRLAQAGVDVVIGSRDGARAVDVAAQTAAEYGVDLRGAANRDAALDAPVVFVAVPWAAHHPTLSGLRDELAGRIVVDLVNPLEFDAAGPFGAPVEEGGAALQAQVLLPGSRVVAGFHHVSAKTLLDAARPLDEDVLVCGDDTEAKLEVIALADRLPGVRGIDAGPLRLSGVLEPMTAVLLSINRRYRTTAGLRLTEVDVARRRTD